RSASEQPARGRRLRLDRNLADAPVDGLARALQCFGCGMERVCGLRPGEPRLVVDVLDEIAPVEPDRRRPNDHPEDESAHALPSSELWNCRMHTARLVPQHLPRQL